MTVFKQDLSDARIYYARNRAIPFLAVVRVIKFYPKRRALVEYLNKEYLTMSTLLRKLKPCGR